MSDFKVHNEVHFFDELKHSGQVEISFRWRGMEMGTLPITFPDNAIGPDGKQVPWTHELLLEFAHNLKKALEPAQ